MGGIYGCEKQEQNLSDLENLPKLKPPPEVPNTPQYVPNELLVRYKPSVRSERSDLGSPVSKNFVKDWMAIGDIKTKQSFLNDQQRVIKNLGNELISESKGEIIEVLDFLPLLGMELLKISSEKATDELLEKLKEDSRVSHVMRNYKVYPLSHHPSPNVPPNDKLWQGHFDSVKPPISKSWGIEKMEMHKAWEEAELFQGVPIEQAEQTVIAFVDSGYIAHPDLPQKILWENKLEKNGQSGKDDDENGYIDDIHGVNFIPFAETSATPIECRKPQSPLDLKDEVGHGQGVMGIAVAALNNQGAPGTELAGVVGTGQVKAMVLKVFCKGIDTQTWTTLGILLDAIEYAFRMKAQIINLSLSLSGGLEEQEVVAFREVLREANDAKSIVVVAAGNSNQDHELAGNQKYPASFHEEGNVMVVAATTWEDLKMLDSDFGSGGSVHIGAPGEYNAAPDIFGGIQWVGFTSVAAPHVSGCAAFLQAQRKIQGKAMLEPRDLKNLIIKSGDQIDSLKDMVVEGRRLNCHKAYLLAMSQ